MDFNPFAARIPTTFLSVAPFTQLSAIVESVDVSFCDVDVFQFHEFNGFQDVDYAHLERLHIQFWNRPNFFQRFDL